MSDKSEAGLGDEASDVGAAQGEEPGGDRQVSGEGGGSEKRRRVDSGSSVSLPQQVVMSDGGRTQLQDSVAASPPRFMNLNDIMKMTNGVTDLTLAHEIAVNDDFRLETASRSADSLEGQIGHVVSKAFWDMLEEKLRTEPDDHSYSLKLLEDVKSSLLELLLPQHVRLRAQIEAVLDLSLIEQKAEHGGVDFQYYAEYVIGVMGLLCAPVRDEQIAALKRETEILALYKQISEVLSQMRLDMVNFTISQLRPILKQHSAEYERNKFNSLLSTQRDNGVDGLEFTRDWLRRHHDKHISSGGAETQTTTAGSVTQSSSTATTVVSAGTAAVSPAAVGQATAAAGQATAASGQATAACITSSRSTVAAGNEAAAAAGTAAASAAPAVSHNSATAGSSAGSKASDVIQTQLIVNSAYVELLDWEAGRVYPETMLVDMKRLVELQDRALTLTLVASVLAVTYSTVGTLIRDLEEFKVTLKKQVMIIISSASKTRASGNSVEQGSSGVEQQSSEGGVSPRGGGGGGCIKETLSSVAEQVSLVTCESLEQHGYQRPTVEQLRVLKGQINSLADHNNPIRSVMRSRVCGFIASALSAPAGLKAVQIPAGFTAVEEELSSACESFVRLISYNYTVYGQHYLQLVQQLSAAPPPPPTTATAV